jgi:hypothetical protein
MRERHFEQTVMAAIESLQLAIRIGEVIAGARSIDNKRHLQQQKNGARQWE